MGNQKFFVFKLIMSLAFAENVHDAAPGEIPYQLSLQAFDKHYCGAVLTEVYGIQVALTSAYCLELDEIKPFLGGSNVKVVGGFVNFIGHPRYPQSRVVKKPIIHESFNRDTMENDIALLLLIKPFRPSINVSAISLPLAFQSTTGELTVSGWGRAFHGGPNPNRLQITQVPVLDDAACKVSYPTTNHTLFCSAALTGHNTYCNAETGSPVRAAAGYLAGVASFLPAQTCNDPNMPQVYVEVSRHVNWIKQKVDTS